MPLYSYKAADRRNRKQIGKMEMDSEHEVRRVLKEMDYYVIEVKKLSALSKDLTSFDIFSRLSYRELSIFCRQLSQITVVGSNIGHSLRIMFQQSSNPVIKSALIQMSDMLKKGVSLAECMSSQHCFPELLVGMIKIGEAGGTLPDILEKMYVYYKKRQKYRNEFISMMIYPAILSAAMIGIIIMSVVMIIPNYAQMFADSGVELPRITRMMIGASSFLSNNYAFLLAGIAVLSTALRYAHSRPSGKRAYDWLKLNAPLVKPIYVQHFNLQFTEALSLMLNSGQQLLPSLRLMQGIFSNSVIDSAIGHIVKEISEGASFSNQLHECRYFLDTVSGLIGVGEESARMPESVSLCAELLGEDSDAFTNRINKVIGPVIILVLGLVLAVIMMAVMLPVFSLAVYV